MKKKILIAVLICTVGVAAAGTYLFNKPRQSIMDAQPDAVTNAPTLVSEFESDEIKSNEKYLGKVIEVTGVINATNLDEKGTLNITLQGGDLGGVGCQFETIKIKTPKKLTAGDKITVKGICTGILIDVVLVDCVITG